MQIVTNRYASGRAARIAYSALSARVWYAVRATHNGQCVRATHDVGTWRNCDGAPSPSSTHVAPDAGALGRSHSLTLSPLLSPASAFGSGASRARDYARRVHVSCQCPCVIPVSMRHASVQCERLGCMRRALGMHMVFSACMLCVAMYYVVCSDVCSDVCIRSVATQSSHN